MIVRVEPVRSDHLDALSLEAAMQDEYRHLYGEPDADPDNFIGGSREVLLLRVDGEPAGLTAWSRWPNGDGKIRLMYVDPRWRGLHLAEVLLSTAEEHMRAAGCTYARFESGPAQPSAHRLYDRHGYTRLSKGFGYYAESPGSVFFGRAL